MTQGGKVSRCFSRIRGSCKRDHNHPYNHPPHIRSHTHTPPLPFTSTPPQQDLRLIRDTRFEDSRKPYSRLITFTRGKEVIKT